MAQLDSSKIFGDLIVTGVGTFQYSGASSFVGSLGIGITAPISTAHIYEDTTTTTAAAGLTIENDGTGDAILQFLLTGAQRWVMGIDNSDNDKFAISHSTDVGSNEALEISTGGVITAPAMSTSEISGATGDVLITRDYLDGGGGGAAGLEYVFEYAVSDETSNLTTGTDKLTIRLPFDMTPTDLRINTNTAPVGSTIIVDVHLSGDSGFCSYSGETALSTKLSIDAGEKTSVSASSQVAFGGFGWADDIILSIDIDQVGSSTAGTGLKFKIYCTKGVTNCAPL